MTVLCDLRVTILSTRQDHFQKCFKKNNSSSTQCFSFFQLWLMLHLNLQGSTIVNPWEVLRAFSYKAYNIH